MAATLVQDTTGTQVQNEATLTATYASTPTQNNLLIAGFFTRSSQPYTAPTGWTLAVEVQNTTENDWAAIYYRVAGASEATAVTFSDLDTSSSGGSSLSISEWSGMATSTPLDVVASTGRTSGTSISSGTTATLAQANELCYAVVGIRAASVTGLAVDNSYTLLNQAGTTDNEANMVGDAYRVVAATDAQTTTFSWSGTQVALAAIACFKEAGGAPATTILRQMLMHH